MPHLELVADDRDDHDDHDDAASGVQVNDMPQVSDTCGRTHESQPATAGHIITNDLGCSVVARMSRNAPARDGTTRHQNPWNRGRTGTE
jgi:hypothetical protein